MEDRPAPLRISKSTSSPHVKLNSHREHPFAIPSRSSSVKTGSRNTSTASSTSTAITLPTDFESGRLEVRKVRAAGTIGAHPKTQDESNAQQQPLSVPQARAHRNRSFLKGVKLERPQRIFSTLFHSLEHKIRLPSQEDKLHQVTQLLNKDSAPSLDMEERGQLPGDSVLPRPPAARSVHHHVPISNVNILATPHKREISEKETHLWLTLEMVADVDLEGGHVVQPKEPLEVIILLDTSIETTDSMAERILGIIQMIGKNLEATDRLAIARVEECDKNGFMLLSPLSLVTSFGIENFLHPLLKNDSLQVGSVSSSNALRRAIRGVSRLFTQWDNPQERCHIFLVSLDSYDALAVPRLHGGIGISTITLDQEFQFQGSTVPNGWHLCPDMMSSDPEIADAVLLNKILRAMTHIRTGMSPGHVTDLELELIPGRDCIIESIVGQTRRPQLRLGETWSLQVLVRVPSMFREGYSDEIQSGMTKILRELHVMLKSEEDTNEQNILTTYVGFAHSLLPSTFVTVHQACTICRVAEEEVNRLESNIIGGFF